MYKVPQAQRRPIFFLFCPWRTGHGVPDVTALRFIDIVAVRCLHSRLKILLFLFSEASLTFR